MASTNEAQVLDRLIVVARRREGRGGRVRGCGRGRKGEGGMTAQA